MKNNTVFVDRDEKKVIAENPLVSIITPVLNGIKYLETCIQSVLNQSYPYIEHIFVDGGSTDGTVDMLSSYKAKYPDRIGFVSEPDKGTVDAWNKGLRMAKGEIFGCLGSDDTFEQDAIQTVVEFFRANPGAYFVFGECNRINEKGKVIVKFRTKDFDLDELINDTCYIPCPSAFYRREVIEKVGLMDTSIHISDLDFFIRAGKVFQIHRIGNTLSNFRMPKDSITCSRWMGITNARERHILIRRYGGSIFSAYRMYFVGLIYDLLRLILGPAYTFKLYSFLMDILKQ